MQHRKTIFSTKFILPLRYHRRNLMEGYRLFGVILLNKEPNLMFERIENFEI
jgi:hypothetical protein